MLRAQCQSGSCFNIAMKGWDENVLMTSLTSTYIFNCEVQSVALNEYFYRQVAGFLVKQINCLLGKPLSHTLAIMVRKSGVNLSHWFFCAHFSGHMRHVLLSYFTNKHWFFINCVGAHKSVSHRIRVTYNDIFGSQKALYRFVKIVTDKFYSSDTKLKLANQIPSLFARNAYNII